MSSSSMTCFFFFLGDFDMVNRFQDLADNRQERRQQFLVLDREGRAVVLVDELDDADARLSIYRRRRVAQDAFCGIVRLLVDILVEAMVLVGVGDVDHLDLPLRTSAEARRVGGNLTFTSPCKAHISSLEESITNTVQRSQSITSGNLFVQVCADAIHS